MNEETLKRFFFQNVLSNVVLQRYYFSSAKRFREEKNCVIGSEQWRITVETASAYINLTDEILEIFSNDSEELLNIASIRQKMEETIDEHQVKLIMDVLVENEIIQPIER